MEDIYFRDLSIADLLALHTNYWLVKQKGAAARYQILSDLQFRYIEAAIRIKVDMIKFPFLSFQISGADH